MHQLFLNDQSSRVKTLAETLARCQEVDHDSIVVYAQNWRLPFLTPALASISCSSCVSSSAFASLSLPHCAARPEGSAYAKVKP